MFQTGADYQLFGTPVTIGGLALQTHHKALILVPVTIMVWLTATFLTRPVTLDRLGAFYCKVRPGGAWGPVARENPDVTCDGLTSQVLGVWLAGSLGVFGALFGLGKLILGEPLAAAALLALALAGGLVVGRELRK